MMNEILTSSWLAQQSLAMEQAATAGPEFLATLRNQAFTRFMQRGFPDQKQERWRFTDVSALAQAGLRRAADFAGESRSTAGESIAGPAAYRLVFINSRFSSTHSRLPQPGDSFSIQRMAGLENGVLERVRARMSETLAETEEPFALTNAALANDGVVIVIPDNLTLLVPIEIVSHVDAPEAVSVHPRILLLMGSNAQAVLVESYTGGEKGAYFTNPLVDVVVGAGSKLDHYVLQRESPSAHHISYTRSSIGSDSHYSRFDLDFGGRLVRHDLVAEMVGQGATASLYGLYMPAGHQHVDYHTSLRHIQPHTFSRQLYKGVLQDKAHSVFNGRIFVAREAQRTDAIQHNKNLLLSDEALADSQPQLEIFADDVRCTHGGTIGQLDLDGLFYLQARGIGAEQARRIMVHAFAGEITGEIKLDSLRERIGALVAERLGGEA
jgi:Fe-S cluster assembly protein SufD